MSTPVVLSPAEYKALVAANVAQQREAKLDTCERALLKNIAQWQQQAAARFEAQFRVTLSKNDNDGSVLTCVEYMQVIDRLKRKMPPGWTFEMIANGSAYAMSSD